MAPVKCLFWESAAVQSPGVRWQCVLVQEYMCEHECVCQPGGPEICTFQGAAGSMASSLAHPTHRDSWLLRPIGGMTEGKVEGGKERRHTESPRLSIHPSSVAAASGSPGRTEVLPGCKRPLAPCWPPALAARTEGPDFNQQIGKELEPLNLGLGLRR